MTGPNAVGAEVVHCYRHPDRRAGVSCQRCDRPICPSCMITASVGFQCPECVKGSPQAQVATKLRRGATPYVTYTLVALKAYFKDGRVKIELGLARGKEDVDRRQEIKKREGEREARAAMTRRFKS